MTDNVKDEADANPPEERDYLKEELHKTVAQFLDENRAEIVRRAQENLKKVRTAAPPTDDQQD